MKKIALLAKSLFVLLTISINCISGQTMSENAQKYANVIEKGHWREKGDAARKLARLEHIPIQDRLMILIQALETECMRKEKGKTIIGSYKTTNTYLKDQYVFALADVGGKGIQFILDYIDQSDGELRDRLIMSLAKQGYKEDFVQSRVIEMAETSIDGSIRTLSVEIISEWSDQTYAPLLKEALKDTYMVRIRTDHITSRTKKDEYGYYNEYYPVRSEAASGLRKLGIDLKRKGWDFSIEE